MTKIKFTEQNAPELISLLDEWESYVSLVMKRNKYGRYWRIDECLWGDNLDVQIKKKIMSEAKRIFHEENPPHEYTSPVTGEKKTSYPQLKSKHDDKQACFLKRCPVCGSFYFCHSYTAQYCSESCRPKVTIERSRKRAYNQRYYQKKLAVHHKEQTCIVCNSVFTPQRRTKKTCSDKCRQRLSRESSRKQS